MTMNRFFLTLGTAALAILLTTGCFPDDYDTGTDVQKPVTNPENGNGTDPEGVVGAEEFIAKKGLQAKGKKVSAMDVKAVRFVEPLHLPEDDVTPQESEAENQAGEIDNSDVDDPIDLTLPDDDIQLTLF